MLPYDVQYIDLSSKNSKTTYNFKLKGAKSRSSYDDMRLQGQNTLDRHDDMRLLGVNHTLRVMAETSCSGAMLVQFMSP